jgi:hypothetical protein
MTRLEQVRAFKAELIQLAEEGIVLDEGTLDRIRAHHGALLADVPDERLSLGMRLASFVGAVALSAAVFFLFYRFWGALGVPAQVGILVAGPLLLVGVTEVLHRWEKTGYFATLAALTAVAAFVLELGALGTIFNLPPTPHAFLAWGLFGILVGRAYDLRLPHFAGMIALGLWVTAMPGELMGEPLPDVWGRGEPLALAGLAFLLTPRFAGAQARWHDDHRIVGMIGLFTGLFMLSVQGRMSWLPWDHDLVEGLYQVIGFAAGAAVTAWGVRERHGHLANGGMIFLTLLCLFKAADWWWEWLPKWAFFLLIAAFAVGVMVALKRVRRAVQEGR